MVPALVGSGSGYDLFKTADQIDGRGLALLAVGFAAAFITAILTVRWLIAFVSSHSFSVFGWYRIALGSLMLAMLFHRSTA